MPQALIFFSIAPPPSDPSRPSPPKPSPSALPAGLLSVFSRSSSTAQPKTLVPSTPSPAPTDDVVKMPTPPWMQGPFLLRSDQVFDLSRKYRKPLDGSEVCRRSLTQGVRGGRGRLAMKTIFKGISRLHRIDGLDGDEGTNFGPEELSAGFSVPLVEGVVEGERGKGWGNGKMPWARTERKIAFRREKKVRPLTAAERSLPEMELSRLRGQVRGMRKWLKVRKAGLTAEKVDNIRAVWRASELVMLKFGLPLCRNMERAMEIVETKTGGFVVWSKKDTLVVYRGCNYQSPLRVTAEQCAGVACSKQSCNKDSEDGIILSQYGTTALNNGEEILPRSSIGLGNSDALQFVNGTLYEREANRLLADLGPRFIDWWYPKPLPVDADLLPEIVPNFRPPFRLCPPRMRSQLTDDELTYLRKLARPLPTHFVLGRNGKLQGLAAAILKLWEKSLIAKIAVKWGIPNTNNAQMSSELTHLTGGVLILRNKFFIILYRGKDFLPLNVANLIAEREANLKNKLLEEETARLKALQYFHSLDESMSIPSNIGTYSEFHDIRTESRHLLDEKWEIKVQIEAEYERLKKELRRQERKLLILQLKTKKSERVLAKLNSSWTPAEQTLDQELLAPEERQVLKKIGLKMHQTLTLGRRGIFGGTVGSIHQHWKHREVVKVITMQRAFSQVLRTATLLEIESGGILVEVMKLRKGHAIIIYRGKNYSRPLRAVPDNLLKKRDALRRSIEMQRRGCLKYISYKRQQTIWDLEQKLRQIEERRKEVLPDSSS